MNIGNSTSADCTAPVNSPDNFFNGISGSTGWKQEVNATPAVVTRSKQAGVTAETLRRDTCDIPGLVPAPYTDGTAAHCEPPHTMRGSRWIRATQAFSSSRPRSSC